MPGRFETVGGATGQPTVIVDYAHTPDGLEEVVTARAEVRLAAGSVVVFGCGGDRDHAKRPAMGAAAAALADRVVVTSDNPRSEDPAAIISDVIAAWRNGDRGEGRRWNPTAARRSPWPSATPVAGDVVVIAGKGHETTQTIGDGSSRSTTVPWCGSCCG